MKQKIFTLLLAIGVLTAFQANAESNKRIRIFADDSGLANTEVKNDSFPLKKETFLSWFSVRQDGSVYLRPKGETNSGGVEAKARADISSIFTVDLYQGDSAKFSVTPVNGEVFSLKTKDGITMPWFSILTAGKEGVPAKFSESGNTEGYLVYDPGISTRLDTAKVAFVGADREGNLSLKYFNEFAIYGNPLPEPLLSGFQYDSIFDPGKLYGSMVFPWFQIYDKKKNGLMYSFREGGRSNVAFNFGGDSLDLTAIGNGGKKGYKPNSNDPIVYAWIDLKLVGDSCVKLRAYMYDGKSDSTSITRLDSIVSYAHAGASQYNSQDGGFNNRDIDKDSIKPFGLGGDSLYHIYLKDDGKGQLSFTVKQTKKFNSEDDWTNGYPTKFNYKGSKMYFYVDSLADVVLPDIFKEAGFAEGGYSPMFGKKSLVEKYLYKYGDDWRPLYVKIENVSSDGEKQIPAEYAGWDWVKENRYNISAAVQTIAGSPELSVSEEENGVSFISTGTAAKFKFEKADTILVSTHWFTEKYTADRRNKAKTFQNTEDVELFRISDGTKYLTVLDVTAFPEVESAGTITNTQLGWKDRITNSEEVRQWFAIAHNYVDSSITLLPVASRKWQLDNGSAKYTGSDTLSFNLGIGLYKTVKTVLESTTDSIVDFNETWYLTSKAKLGSSDYKLVIADGGSSTQTRIWFDLKSTLNEWAEGKNGEYASIKKGDKYYRGDSSLVDKISNSDIRAHWKTNRVEKVNSKAETNAWRFTPVVDTIYGVAQNKHFAGDTVYTFVEGADILLVDKENEKVLDTVRVTYDIDPEKFDLFGTLGKKKVTIVSQEGKYIDLGTPSGTDSTYVAAYKAIDDTDRGNEVHVIAVDEQKLTGDALYPKIQYYAFYIEKDGKRYFLNAKEGNNVKWIRKDTITKEDTEAESVACKFALPKSAEGYYLQTLDSTVKAIGARVIGFGIGGRKLEVASIYDRAGITEDKEEGIYSAIDFYNSGDADFLSWKFSNVNIKPEDWVSDSDLNFEEGKDVVEGVLGGNLGGSIGYLPDDNGTKFGILTTGTPSLKLSPALRSTAAGSEVETYHIISDDGLYLSDKRADLDDRATFTDDSTQAFAFHSESDGSFAIVSAASIDGGDLRYLSAIGINLIFTDNEGEKLDFTWTEGVTAIKAIAARRTVYGVAGGVKIAGAQSAVAIYNIDGRLVTKETVTSPNQTIAVPAGIYVVKIGAEVTKVVVK